MFGLCFYWNSESVDPFETATILECHGKFQDDLSPLAHLNLYNKMRSRLHQTAVVFSMEKGKYFAVQIFRLAIYMFNFAQNMGQIENDFITTNILTH